MVNPGPHMSSYLDMCRCFYKLKEAYHEVSQKKLAEERSRIVLQLVPIDHILRPSAFGGYTVLGMKDIAFSVYSKCFARVTRKASICTFFFFTLKKKSNDPLLDTTSKAARSVGRFIRSTICIDKAFAENNQVQTECHSSISYNHGAECRTSYGLLL